MSGIAAIVVISAFFAAYQYIHLPTSAEKIEQSIPDNEELKEEVSGTLRVGSINYSDPEKKRLSLAVNYDTEPRCASAIEKSLFQIDMGDGTAYDADCGGTIVHTYITGGDYIVRYLKDGVEIAQKPVVIGDIDTQILTSDFIPADGDIVFLSPSESRSYCLEEETTILWAAPEGWEAVKILLKSLTGNFHVSTERANKGFYKWTAGEVKLLNGSTKFVDPHDSYKLILTRNGYDFARYKQETNFFIELKDCSPASGPIETKSPWGEKLVEENSHVPLNEFRAYYIKTDSFKQIADSEVLVRPVLIYGQGREPIGYAGTFGAEQYGAYFIGKVNYPVSTAVSFDFTDPGWDVMRFYVDGELEHEYRRGGDDPLFFERVLSRGEHVFEIEYDIRWHAGEFIARIEESPSSVNN